MVFENCSELTVTFACIGMFAVYALFGLLIGSLIRELTSNCSASDREFLSIIGGVFWPAAIIVGIMYVIGLWLLFPLIGATKRELDDAEARLNRKIEGNYSAPVDVSDDLDIFDFDASFKVGDVITGIVPQTDYDGEIMSYKHLYQGCKCRVLKIDSNDSMKVILIDHKDKAAHAHKIGETFTVPARNFTLVKKVAKKRKVAKKKVAKKKSKR